MRALVALGLLVAAGCIFEGPSTDQTAFACAPDRSCPPGYTCEGNTCVRPGGGGVPDAGLPDAPGPGEPDGGPPPPPPPDDGPLPPGSQTLTFGDNPVADVPGTAADAVIRSNQANTEFGGDADCAADADPLVFCLMVFDISQIPVGSVVESAQLVLSINNAIENGSFEIQRVRRFWDEADVTFNRADVNVSWPSPGAEGATDNTVSGAFSPRQPGQINIDIDTVLVQRWVDTPSGNFGFRIRANSPDGRGGNWASRETSNGDQRPFLRVTFR